MIGRALAIAALLLSGSFAVGQEVLYVNADATGAGDGTSWQNAYTDLQDALDFTLEHIDQGPFEIWVAAGVYKPDRGTGDRWASFELLSNLALYGGFAGGETDRYQRDPERYETILSGDLLGNDDPDFVPESDCCYAPHEAGCDDDACEQVVCTESQLPCCDEWDELCAGAAAFYCCDLCRPSRCDNSYNVIKAFETDETPILDGFTVTGGEANRFYEDGDVDDRSMYGAGLFARAASPQVRNTKFSGNAAYSGSGAQLYHGEATFSECVFVENFAFLGGAALDYHNGEPSLTGCSFIQNIGMGAAIGTSRPISHCRFVNNTRVGLYLTRGAPNIEYCMFIGNEDGGLDIFYHYPQLFNCGFFGNTATYGGGIHSDNNMILLNCVFSGNKATFSGGAIKHSLLGMLILNCVFVGNSARGAGGIYSTGNMTIAHSVFWGNSNDEGTGEDAQINYGSYVPVLRYNNIQGWTGELGGIGNIDVDPLFIDSDGPDDVPGTEDDNFRLSMESPLINAGDPNPPLLQRWDGDRHFRKLYGRVDIGAYEFGIGDFNWDRVADLGDFDAWQSCATGPVGDIPYPDPCNAFDFEGDSDVDLTDYAGFQRECGTVHTIKRPKRISPFHRDRRSALRAIGLRDRDWGNSP